LIQARKKFDEAQCGGAREGMLIVQARSDCREYFYFLSHEKQVTIYIVKQALRAKGLNIQSVHVYNNEMPFIC